MRTNYSVGFKNLSCHPGGKSSIFLRQAGSKSARAGSGAAVVEEMQRPGGRIEVVRMSILTSS